MDRYIVHTNYIFKQTYSDSNKENGNYLEIDDTHICCICKEINNPSNDLLVLLHMKILPLIGQTKL